MPKPTNLSITAQIRIEQELEDLLKEWRRARPEMPTRSAAIREILWEKLGPATVEARAEANGDGQG